MPWPTETPNAAAYQALQTALSTSAANSKIGSFTRDLTAAGGTQAITGVGFTPKAIIFLSSNAAGAGYGTIGFDNGTLTHSLGIYNTVGSFALTAFSIVIGADASNYQSAKVTTLGTDGFTVTWNAKVGTPTGTGTIFYLALR